MKIALVTGASSGLGKEIARILRELGFEVHAPTHAEMDITSPVSVRTYRKRVVALGVLVNNAAILHEGLRESIETNALGAALVTSVFWPLLVASEGRVVNVSSRESLSGSFGNRAYSISKSTLNGITRVASMNKDGVIVNACCPGWFRSRLGGERAPISAAEAADTPVWLATEAPASINGKFLINRETVPW